MDLTISITNGKIETTLFKKELNLYLYIPPHSAHAPDVLAGLVIGQVLQFHQLYTRKDDVIKKSSNYFVAWLIAATHKKPFFHFFQRDFQMLKLSSLKALKPT